MTFEQFITHCHTYLNVPEEKLFFRHNYTKGGYDYYTCSIIGKVKYEVMCGNDFMSGVYQYSYSNDFVNCKSLDEALNKLKEVL